MSSGTDSSESDAESASSADIYQRQPSTFVLAHELAMVAETYQEEGDNDPVHALLPSHAGPTACSSSHPHRERRRQPRRERPLHESRDHRADGDVLGLRRQYQVDAKALIQDVDTPAYVAVTGKPENFRDR